MFPSTLKLDLFNELPCSEIPFPNSEIFDEFAEFKLPDELFFYNSFLSMPNLDSLFPSLRTESFAAIC